ncbi:MAG TPA: adenosylmethionine--8-amino-7-oxononanoate transaminase [Candidatus Gastranaerophilales bacterium]|nr:adenosylmethionine--8-amino-7-oxononanoate transaminase [Candidatus Gastranaerophilales bacterium]
METNDIVAKDKKYVWHPFTQMKDYETDSPLIIDRGEGIYIWDIQGNKYIDAISSWWVNTLGHSRPRLNEALKQQLEKIEHVLLAGFSHVPAIELAEKLIKLMPDNLTRVFYSDNGSTAVEVALKMAYQYCQQSGKIKKTKFVALKNSYHGDTIGAVSVGGIDVYHKIYKPMLFDIHQAESPYCYRCLFEKEKNACNIECLSSVEEIFKKYSDEIAGIIVEPLAQAAAGMIIYPAEYLKKLRKLCDEYDVLLIDDEVAMGFGRTGKMFAFEHAGIAPDLVCLAKGLTAGYLPMAVTIASEKIYQAFYDDYDKLKTFFHGHSFTGNPLAASVAVENLKIFEDEKIIESIQPKIKVLGENLQKFKEFDCVGDIRHIGMIGAVEIVKNKTTKEQYEFKDRIGSKIYREALNNGAVLRPLGSVVYFMPPYVITEEEIEHMIDIGVKSLKNALY